MGVLADSKGGGSNFESGAIQAMWPYAYRELQEGIAAEWARLATGGD
jgi:hypothetical protein